MATTEIAEKSVHVNDEGFLTEYDEWDPEIATTLKQQVEIALTPKHWEVIIFLRHDFKKVGESATSRHAQIAGGFPVKEQFQLFPKKLAKKMAYIAGLPNPKGCV